MDVPVREKTLVLRVRSIHVMDKAESRMQIPIIKLPRLVPVLPSRKPQDTIPQTRGEREALKRLVADYVKSESARLTPPFVLGELRAGAEDVVRLGRIDPLYTDYVGVLLNNEVWREQLAAVPYERRLLL